MFSAGRISIGADVSATAPLPLFPGAVVRIESSVEESEVKFHTIKIFRSHLKKYGTPLLPHHQFRTMSVIFQQRSTPLPPRPVSSLGPRGPSC